MHEVVEVTKLLGSLYLVDVSFENGVMHVIYSIMVFDNDAHPKCQTHEMGSQFGSPG